MNLHVARQISLRGIRRGAAGLLPVFLMVLIVAALGGGAWWWTTQGAQEKTTDAILHEVGRRDFRLDITERGEIKSGGVTEVRSLVKAKNTTGMSILRIVPEGTEVKEGDFLVELDSSAMKEELTTQKINYNTAKALMVEAQNLYETAIIAKREYLEGTYVQERQIIESEVFVAEENLNRAKEYYAYSKKLAAKGYVNELQLEADRFAVEKSEKELAAAHTKLKVLDEFTKAKMVKQFESDIATTEARWESAKNSFELEDTKVAEIQDQIDKCTITAPREGTVVFAHDRDRGGESSVIIQEGSVIRERQVIIQLPDPSSMEVELTINESLIQFLKKGMPARIVPVGFGGEVLRGEVLKINQYAEPTGWRKANVKEYKATVSVEKPPLGLRPGMTASVTVMCEEINDAMQVPVQAVYSHGNQFYCFVYQAGQWEARPVVTGPTNDKFYVIESGLDVADRVAMNPRTLLDKVQLPKIAPERQQRAVAQSPLAEAEKPTTTDVNTARKPTATDENAGG
ncbi:MAG: HlyD family efflux transporter periplasmic adaptor subunit [Bythopirellula sp.]|nr:HlyD family efflux transporter periplasmic adaptor subunit [Bythopirellula sp.]